MISDMLMHGLSLDSGNLPSFCVVKSSKKFLKIKVDDNTQVRFSLLKNAKRETT